jgi:hypothetical protein
VRSAPTIIVFTREPIAGQTKTRLIPRIGAANAAALADAFNRDALAKAQSLGAPLVIAGAAAANANRSPYFRALARRFHARVIDQGAGNLGARMARALALYGAAGAMLIGTDTPSLPTRILRENIRLLRRERVVLGPSLDGGYYLVGVRGAIPDIFRGIRWGGPRVLAQTRARLERSGIACALGPAWYDVDRWSDLALLACHLGGRGLIGPHRYGSAARKHAAEPSPCPATTRLLQRLGLLPAGG